MYVKICLSILLLLSLNQVNASEHLDVDPASRALCERLLTANLARWKKEALANLAQISSYPIYPVDVAVRSPLLIATALNIKPEDVNNLVLSTMRVSREGSRLQLTLEGWPGFHRALISLKKPEVLKDFRMNQGAPAEIIEDFLKDELLHHTLLFYPIRELPREMELGMVIPLHQKIDPNQALPDFEFQIAVLKPCAVDDELKKQTYTDESGAHICVDYLVNLSTMPTEIEWHPEAHAEKRR